jgi:hypothetical protein
VCLSVLSVCAFVCFCVSVCLCVSVCSVCLCVSLRVPVCLCVSHRVHGDTRTETRRETPETFKDAQTYRDMQKYTTCRDIQRRLNIQRYAEIHETRRDMPVAVNALYLSSGPRSHFTHGECLILFNPFKIQDCLQASSLCWCAANGNVPSFRSVSSSQRQRHKMYPQRHTKTHRNTQRHRDAQKHTETRKDSETHNEIAVRKRCYACWHRSCTHLSDVTLFLQRQKPRVFLKCDQ